MKRHFFLLLLLCTATINPLHAQEQSRTLKSDRDKELKPPYASMALSAKYIGSAASDPDCVFILSESGKVSEPYVFKIKWNKGK